jgi:CRP/FNR family transcriptional regulator, cyclic AMP receptor protein
LFNSSEKRLARTLRLHARYGKREAAPQALPKLSQEGLAETIGTTRSRVSSFMNTFRKLGFIDYDADGVMVHPSLVSVVLHEVSRKRLMLGCSHRTLPSRSSSSMRFSALERSVAASRAIAISPAR